MDLSGYKMLAETFEALLVGIGLIIAGVWAVFLFFAQRRDQLLKEQEVLKIGVDVEQATLPGSEDLFLDIVVRIRNEGTRNTYIRYDGDDHLTVTPMAIGRDGRPVAGQPIDRVLKRGESKVATNSILVGGEVLLPFFVKVEEPGLFHVRFYVRPNPEQRLIIERAGGIGPNSDVVISANCYFVVVSHDELSKRAEERIGASRNSA